MPRPARRWRPRLGSFARRLRGCPSACGRGIADRRGGERRRCCHRLPARRRRAIGGAAQGRPADAACAVRRASACSARRRRDRCGGRSATSCRSPPAVPQVERDLWRLSTAPTRGVELGRVLTEQADAELLYDWAGGLVWAALPPAADAHAPLVRAAIGAAGVAMRRLFARPPPFAPPPRCSRPRSLRLPH